MYVATRIFPFTVCSIISEQIFTYPTNPNILLGDKKSDYMSENLCSNQYGTQKISNVWQQKHKQQKVNI